MCLVFVLLVFYIFLYNHSIYAGKKYVFKSHLRILIDNHSDYFDVENYVSLYKNTHFHLLVQCVKKTGQGLLVII